MARSRSTAAVRAHSWPSTSAAGARAVARRADAPFLSQICSGLLLRGPAQHGWRARHSHEQQAVGVSGVGGVRSQPAWQAQPTQAAAMTEGDVRNDHRARPPRRPSHRRVPTAPQPTHPMEYKMDRKPDWNVFLNMAVPVVSAGTAVTLSVGTCGLVAPGCRALPHVQRMLPLAVSVRSG